MYMYGALYPITDLEHWCELYGLWPKEIECESCGELLEVNVPFATKFHRGLCSKPCSCGNDNTPIVFVTIEKKKAKGYAKE